jgi:hypothetical protein
MLKIMSNIRLVFYGDDNETELSCHVNVKNEITIKILENSFDRLISLESVDARRFANELTKQCNILDKIVKEEE